MRLQPTTPGTPQAGHVNVSGTVLAGHLSGDGSAVTGVDAAKLGGQASSAYGQVGATNNWSGVNNFNNASNSFTGSGNLLTGLNASALASGTVPDARLSVGGDLSGPLSAARVVKLQSSTVSNLPPEDGNVLHFDGSKWVPFADGVTLPFLKSFNGTSDAFHVFNQTGSAVKGWAGTDGSGVIGVSDTFLVVENGHGVYGQSGRPNGFGVVGRAGNSAAGAGRFFGNGQTVTLGTSAGAVHNTGFYYRTYALNSPSVAVPMAYGTVNAAGTIAGGTGNFSVVKDSTGFYTVTVDGETYSNSSHVVTVTPVVSSPRTFGVVNPGNGGFVLRFWDSAGALTDTQFQFTVWTRNPQSPG